MGDGMNLSLNEVCVAVHTGGDVILWGVRGIHNTLYPTKIVAEIAARNWFPSEDSEARYGRIYFRAFYTN